MPAHHGSRPEVHVRQHPLPGNADLFELTLPDGNRLAVATDPRSGTRDLAITLPGADHAAATVRMADAEATTLAVLLSGIHLVVGTAGQDEVTDAVGPHTVTLTPASPAIGRRLDEVTGPAPGEAMVIAVIRDDTADLVERDSERPCQPGDRLVLVGRPAALRELSRYLAG